MQRAVAPLLAVLAFLGAARIAASHCEIPCGIYDDLMRVRMIEEDIATVEKSMAKIAEIGAVEKPEWNQLVRWIANKDDHANRIQDAVSQYFLTQRIRYPGEEDGKALAKYHRQVSLLHRLLVAAMKMKQTVDPAHAAEGRKLLGEFAETYFDAETLARYREHHGGGK